LDDEREETPASTPAFAARGPLRSTPKSAKELARPTTAARRDVTLEA
jgi:hypothetical protein